MKHNRLCCYIQSCTSPTKVYNCKVRKQYPIFLKFSKSQYYLSILEQVESGILTFPQKFKHFEEKNNICFHLKQIGNRPNLLGLNSCLPLRVTILNNHNSLNMYTSQGFGLNYANAKIPFEHRQSAEIGYLCLLHLISLQTVNCCLNSENL